VHQYSFSKAVKICPEISECSKRAKKKAKIYGDQYEKMKSDLGYESPVESDGSLSSDDIESDTEKHDAGYSSCRSNNIS
jgi:hypothetical protein